MPCISNFKFCANGLSTCVDFDDVFVRKEFFNNGGLWGWGSNAFGKLGNNAITNTSSPIQTISGGTDWKQIETSSTTTAGIKSNGTLWLWGRNNNGQLGTNNLTDRSSPVQTVSGGTNWKQISSARGYSVGAIKTDGTLWTWGCGRFGVLGNNSVTDRSSPVQTIAGGSNWNQVVVGYTVAGAIKTDNTLWMWGYNGSAGVLGNNSNINQSSPVQTISGGTNWKQLTIGYSHAAAVKTDGTLWLWGSASFGQLGDGANTNRSSPVQTVSVGANWKQVSAGQFATAATKTDGTLWLWGGPGGSNGGVLGDNTTAAKNSPVQTISGGNNWKCVSLDTHVAAIKTDGTLWTWGCNGFGQLGDNTISSKSSPIQTISGGTNWICVSAGKRNFGAENGSTFAIREGCW